MEINDVLNKLSTARMEYQTTNHSVLNRFVVPYFIDKCDLRASSHSVALVGSRGSGKSTYIQYFSHSTRFDPSLESVDEREFECIVLYWKPDITYCQGLKIEWLGDDAILFFMVHAALALLDELACMLENVNNHFPVVMHAIESKRNFLSCVSNVTRCNIESLDQLKRWIRDQRYNISTRLNPINTDGMISIEPKEMLVYLIGALREDCSNFSTSIFKIFIDEFELLTEHQQKIINTYRKESGKNLNWNVAYKANSSPTKETTSNQWLQRPDDFREEDLDGYIQENYKIYAAEILILTLQNAGLSCSGTQLTPQFLGNRNNVRSRKEKEYQNKTLDIVGRFLPTPSIKMLSEFCLEKKAIKNKVKDALSLNAIDKKTTDAILKDASLAITFLGTYKQKSFDPGIFTKYIEGDDSVHKKMRDKINSYEYNTLLSLNLQHAYIQIPVYAGFDRFVTMTTPNVRHFKELCFSALKQCNDVEVSHDIQTIEDIPVLPLECMHLGTISTSDSLVKEVISYPPYGNKLSQMVNRIGELFKISQKSVYQSEPERDIFSIEYDFAGEDRELEDFIQSALCWRVLVEDESRRIKDDIQSTNREFQLNPIYSAKFGISFRKKRGIVFTVEKFKCLISGTYDQYSVVRKSYQKQWKVDDGDIKQGILL